MNEKNCNGYKNYETWAVSLWLNNDEPSYRYWRKAAKEERRQAVVCSQVREGIWAADRAAVYRLSDRIKEEVIEAAPELRSCVYADLMGAAFDSVDWHEVAESFLEE